MPVLNVEGTIGRALESVVSQSIPPTEILVIDGLSSDATLERVAAYRKHLTAVISEPDKGLFDAINKGLRLATGDVVAILNGDDFYAHNMIFDAYCKKFRDPEVGIVFADVEFFAEGAPRPYHSEIQLKTLQSHHVAERLDAASSHCLRQAKRL